MPQSYERPGTAERWDANLKKKFPEKGCGNCRWLKIIRHEMDGGKEVHLSWVCLLGPINPPFCNRYQRFNPTE